MPKSPTPQSSADERPNAVDLGSKKKLTLLKGMDLTGLLIFGAPGIVTHMASDDGELELVKQPPRKSERH